MDVESAIELLRAKGFSVYPPNSKEDELIAAAIRWESADDNLLENSKLLKAIRAVMLERKIPIGR